MPQKMVKHFAEKNYGTVLYKKDLPTRIVAIEISKARKNTVEIYMDSYQMAVELLDDSANKWEDMFKIYFIGMPPMLAIV